MRSAMAARLPPLGDDRIQAPGLQRPRQGLARVDEVAAAVVFLLSEVFGYEIAMLVGRVGPHLTPDLVSELKQSLVA